MQITAQRKLYQREGTLLQWVAGAATAAAH